MKNFFKRNLFGIVSLSIGIVLILLGSIVVYCALIACVVFGVVCLYYATSLRKKYKKIEDEPENLNLFDATKLDYDEEVYYIGDKNLQKKVKTKSFFSKVSLNAPSIALYMLGFGFFSISIISIIKSLI